MELVSEANAEIILEEKDLDEVKMFVLYHMWSFQAIDKSEGHIYCRHFLSSVYLSEFSSWLC